MTHFGFPQINWRLLTKTCKLIVKRELVLHTENVIAYETMEKVPAELDNLNPQLHNSYFFYLPI